MKPPLHLLLFLSLAQWLPAQEQPLSTPRAAEGVWAEYPRPNMRRADWQNLNGYWDLWVLDADTDKNSFTGKVLVPFPPESSLSEVGLPIAPQHILQYSRTFRLPENWQGKRVLLHFGAVDYEAEVSVNGVRTGWHRGGYDPFSYDITEQLIAEGDQKISLTVTDSTDMGRQPVGNQRLHPGLTGHSAVSGIWQTVWLEAVPDSYIASYRCEPDLDRQRVVVRVSTAGSSHRDLLLKARVRYGNFTAESTGKAGTPLMLNVTNPRPWSPKDPFLYDLEILLTTADGAVADRVEGYFGMRKMAVQNDGQGRPRLFLNGEPLYLPGVQDQGYWPDGLYTPASDEALRSDMRHAKEMGFLLLRKNAKVEPQRWYYHCDTLGLLVWQDMPAPADASGYANRHFRTELKAVSDALFNHPSVVIWSPVQDGISTEQTERYVVEMKSLDPGRLVGYSGSSDSQVKADLEVLSAYPGPVAASAHSGPGSAWVLGGFGGIGLPPQGHRRGVAVSGSGPATPSEALLEVYETLVRKAMHLSDTAALSASVYVQLTDGNNQVNGLITANREIVKLDPVVVSKINSGFMAPFAEGPTPVFAKRKDLRLSTFRPGAEIWFAFGNGDWKRYDKPLSIRKTTAIRTKAVWPDGTTSREAVLLFEKPDPISSKAPKGLLEGIRCQYFDGQQRPDTLPAQGLSPLAQVVPDMAIDGVAEGEGNTAVIEGWMEVPATGVYVFVITTAGEVMLEVARQQLFNHRQENQNAMALSSAISLRKGRHPIRFSIHQKAGLSPWKFHCTDEAGQPVALRWWHQIAEE